MNSVVIGGLDNACSILYMLNSLLSNIINFEGPNFEICSHNSDPIEPPPPVTRILLLENSFLISFQSISIFSLPNKSSIDTSLNFERVLHQKAYL